MSTATTTLQDVPKILKSTPNWVSWRLVNKDGRDTKEPFVCGTDKHASSTDPSTWRSFDEAVASTAISSTEGIGFVIGGEAVTQQLVGIDIDGCRNPETEELASWADELLARLPSYTERTPSGYGLRIWVRGKLPGQDRVFKLDPKVGFGDKVQIEIYDNKKYFTITGDIEGYYGFYNTIEEFDLSEVYRVCQELRAKFPVPQKLKSTAVTTGEGAKIQSAGTVLTTKLELLMHGSVESTVPFVIKDDNGNSLEYPSHSEADMALATQLAIKHGDNSELIDEEFRNSPLFREKWDRDDYRKSTIDKAIKTAASMAESNQPVAQPSDAEPAHSSEHDLTPEELETHYAQEWPVIPLKPQPGPEWSDDIYFGLSGEIIRKASQYNEAHPAGMLLDLLVSLGSMFGRACYFNINSTRHYTNEFMARVGDSSRSRKGSGRDEIDRLLKLVDPKWFNERTISGFGSAEAIISQIKDATTQQRFNSKKDSFVNTIVPGVADKRLCIREGELASVFLLASKAESRADVVLRDGWDSKPLKNVVKGKNSDGFSNSATCQEPHLSISGDTTRGELVKKMPDGADENGFGNRFLYAYVFRRQLCPLGGPELDWSKEVLKLLEVLSFVRKEEHDENNLLYYNDRGCVGLTASAKTTWVRMYTELENNHLPGLAGKMTSRAGAHIRRLALIYAMLDLSTSVDVRHLRAAERLWNYCADSAQYIFNGTTKSQIKLLQWLEKQQAPVTLSNIRDGFYHRNEKAEFVKAIVGDLVRMKRLQQTGDTYQIVNK